MMPDQLSGHLTTIFTVIGGLFTFVGLLLLRSPRIVFGLGKESRANRQGRILIFTQQLNNGHRVPRRESTLGEHTGMRTELLGLIEVEAGEATEEVEEWRTWWTVLPKRAREKARPKVQLAGGSTPRRAEPWLPRRIN